MRIPFPLVTAAAEECQNRPGWAVVVVIVGDQSVSLLSELTGFYGVGNFELFVPTRCETTFDGSVVAVVEPLFQISDH